ncbi:DUF3592 domain-containing protein [Parerythrobacter aestuarii]|uniref:DUF3592 domain-containing protein n=1 Tax=Parerythrobacter aestuarii TaxID=3020909 RepID=UPI0024DE390D|nr:DUF3592 domain-containing protein [Parerythrobacter aestuarii]
MIGGKGLVGAAFLLAGLVFVGGGVFKTWEVNALAATGVHTRGEVTYMKRKSTSGRSGGRSWYAWVVFRTSTGEEIGFENRQGSALRSHEVGDIVDVVYDPADPSDAIIDNFWTRFAWVFATLFASVFVLLGGWLVRRDRREQREDGWIR